MALSVSSSSLTGHAGVVSSRSNATSPSAEFTSFLINLVENWGKIEVRDQGVVSWHGDR